jgi:hypothetical protein
VTAARRGGIPQNLHFVALEVKDERQIKMTIDNVMQLVDRATASMRMSKVSAIEVLERMKAKLNLEKKCYAKKSQMRAASPD